MSGVDSDSSPTCMGEGGQSEKHARLSGSTSRLNTVPVRSWGIPRPNNISLDATAFFSGWLSLGYPRYHRGETCGQGFQLLLKATHGWFKNRTNEQLWGSRKTASEIFHMDMAFPESSEEQGGKPKWKLKLAKPGNALPAPKATGRMRYYLFSYTAYVITKSGMLGQQLMAMLRAKKCKQDLS